MSGTERRAESAAAKLSRGATFIGAEPRDGPSATTSLMRLSTSAEGACLDGPPMKGIPSSMDRLSLRISDPGENPFVSCEMAGDRRITVSSVAIGTTTKTARPAVTRPVPPISMAFQILDFVFMITAPVLDPSFWGLPIGRAGSGFSWRRR